MEIPPARFARRVAWQSRKSENLILAKSGGSLPKDEFIVKYGKSSATAYRHIDKSKKKGPKQDQIACDALMSAKRRGQSESE